MIAYARHTRVLRTAVTAVATSIAQRPIRKRPPAAGRGRKRGTPNKVTLEVREAFRVLLESNAENMQSWLERTAARSPAKALAIIAQLAEYVTPRLQRAEVRATRDDTADLAAARLGQSGVTAVEAAAAYRQILELDGDNASAREVIVAAASQERARAVIEGELANEPKRATAPASIAATLVPASAPDALAAPAAPVEATMHAADFEPQPLPADVATARERWIEERARGER